MVAQRDESERARISDEYAGLDVLPVDETGEFQTFSGFGGFGEWGVSSVELPAVHVEQQARWEAEQRALWERAQALRERVMAKLERLRRQRPPVISGPAFDLLQTELAAGLLPDVYREGEWWLVWSAHDQRRYSLPGWEAKAQEYLSIDDPEKVTHRLRVTPLFAQAATRPWHERLDSRLAPSPQLRRTPPPQWQTPYPQSPQPHTPQQAPQARTTPRLPWSYAEED